MGWQISIKKLKKNKNNTEMKSLTFPAKTAEDKQMIMISKQSKVEMNKDFKTQKRKDDRNMEERKINIYIYFVSLKN